MKYFTLGFFLLGTFFVQAQVVTIQSTSFEEPALFGGSYTDTGDAAVAHDLINNTDEPMVDFTSTGGEVGFNASYLPYDTPGVGLTDGDFVGVTNFTGTVGTYTDGVQGYQIGDADGTMVVTFDAVDFNGFSNNEVSIDVFVSETGWEGDGTTNDSGNDAIRIYLRDTESGTETDLLNTIGSDIDDLAIEGAWNTYTANVDPNREVELIFWARSNSSSEAVYIDNIIFSGEATPAVVFDQEFTAVSEADGTVAVTLSVDGAPSSDATVEVQLRSGGTAVQGADFTLAAPIEVTFPSGSDANQTVNIPIIDNGVDNSDVFFVVTLANADGLIIGGEDLFSTYILDDDTVVPAGDDTVLNLSYLTSYLVDADGTAEITAYDAVTQRLFVTNSESIEILDFSDPSSISPISSIDITSYGDGVQSVAVSNGIVAAAVSANVATDNGLVLFMDTDGANQSTVMVGALPDMVTFTPDGTKLVVANEGEPNDDYSIDPEGSVSVIDVTGGLGAITAADVVTIGFTSLNGQEDALNAAGVRIYGPGASAAQDLEPEYIAISDDSQMAYVALQENNAAAIINLVDLELEAVAPLGLKDHSLPQNSLDLSDETDFVFNASWPVYGMYMPDAIAYYEVAGVGYVITANEGDAREYDTYEEERKIDDDDYTLDPTVFSDIDILELETNLAEINVTNASGDANDDGLYEEIHVFGGRSFSIFNAETGDLVYDSGNDFEVITAADPVYGEIFNASNSNNNLKNRSDNKGPEPEGVVVMENGGNYYAFILLERIGGVMAYDVTNPANPVFLQYVNSRGAVAGDDETGDLGPEGVVYVDADVSPTGQAYLVVSNEVSATLSIYTLVEPLSVNDNQFTSDIFSVYPNPTTNIIRMSETSNYTLFDLSGRKLKVAENQNSLDLSALPTGVYFVRNKKGAVQRVVKK